jgi:hypothetical protein
MKRILYASGSVLTGDAVAHSVVQYATVLAKADTADTVTIPVYLEGQVSTVEMLIGPSSQLMVEDAGDDPAGAFADGSYLTEIDQRRDRLENPPAIIPEGEPTAPVPTIEDYV